MSILPIGVPLLMALLGSPHASTSDPAVRHACAYEPSGTVYMTTGEVLSFYEDSNTIGACSGVSVSISPANGTAGFKTSAAGCGTTAVTAGSVFRVRGCASGTVTVTVSSGGTVLQTIQVVVD